MDNYSINLTPVKTLTYMEDINAKRCSELKRRIWRRLIDNTSPKSKDKRQHFNVIVKRVVGVDNIISIVSEMEAAGEKETDKMCKDMLFDNLF